MGKLWTKVRFWWWKLFNPPKYEKETKKLALKYAIDRDQFLFRGTISDPTLQEELKAYEGKDDLTAAGLYMDTVDALAHSLKEFFDEHGVHDREEE